MLKVFSTQTSWGTSWGTSATFIDSPSDGRLEILQTLKPLQFLVEARTYATSINTMWLGPVKFSDFEVMQYFLELADQAPSTTWSALEELAISVVVPPDYETPKIVLPKERFPALRCLRLNSVCMDWDSPILPQLTHAELRNVPGTDVQQLSDFATFVPRWESLIELRMHNFLTIEHLEDSHKSVMNFDDDMMSSQYFMRPPNLRTLVIEGPIAHVPHMLYHLDAPPHPETLVHVIAPAYPRAADDRRSTFTAMVPFAQYLPSVLAPSAEPYTVTVRVTGGEATFTAASPSHGTLVLGVVGADMSQFYERGRLFREAIVALAEVLATREVRIDRLELRGDLSHVSCEDWLAVFQSSSCAGLRELAVEWGAPGDAVGPLWEAMLNFSETNGTPVCPNLGGMWLKPPGEPGRYECFTMDFRGLC